MIKPVEAPQVSAFKIRTGLQSVAELLPRLVRHYEKQAELLRRAQQEQVAKANPIPRPVVMVETKAPANQQVMFGWYE